MKDDFQHLIAEIDDFYTNIRDIPVLKPISREAVQAHLAHKFGNFAEAHPIQAVIQDVARMLEDWIVHVTHPRYFGLFNPSVHPVSIMADTLTAAFNPQLAAWSHAPAANEIEQWVLVFLLKKLDFDVKTSIANFTTGGAEANLSALTVALTKKFPDYATQGAPRKAAFYGSQESHDTLTKMAHQTGIGRQAFHNIPVNSALQFDVRQLRQQIEQDINHEQTPFMVVATAGTTAAGVIDPLPEIANVCDEFDLWLHVDAAWGGSALLSPKLRGHFRGIERADSVTWDAHKWLSVPMGAGMFFCKHRAAVEQTFAVDATYMPSETVQAIDPYITSIQWSRRFIGLKVFMTLATLGEQGMVECIEGQTTMGERLRDKLLAAGWTVVNTTPLPVVCFTHDRFQADSKRINAFLDWIYERGQIWISKVSLANGTQALRACITSFRTDEQDLDALIEELKLGLQHF